MCWLETLCVLVLVCSVGGDPDIGVDGGYTSVLVRVEDGVGLSGCRQVLAHPWTQDRDRVSRTGHIQQQDDLWARSSSFSLLGDERRSMGVVARLEAELAGQGYSMRAMG